MTGPDSAPVLHQPLQSRLAIVRLELGDITSGLWQAVGYNQDIIQAALDTFPSPARRRSDTVFSCEPDQETVLREKAAALGPGRKDTESLEDLGIYRADAEIIEPGQLHKTVTELWRALINGGNQPIIVFASDRKINRFKKDSDEQLDAELISSDRLLQIGGQGLADSASFFYRAGKFDNAVAEADTDVTRERTLARPDNEFEMTEKFLGDSLDEIEDTVLQIGYDPENGQVSTDSTGQVRRLGTIRGREILLVHKEKAKDGSTLDTTDTILLMGSIAAALTTTTETIVGYWTSSTYKPSRWMSAIRAGIKAAQEDRKLRVAVPTYGYVDLSLIKGEDPKPPTIQNIAGELGKAAEEAFELRAFLDSLNVQEQ